MKCGSCNHTDGLYYPSDPAQVRCALTGEYHFFEHECDVIMKVSGPTQSNTKKLVPCLICGEGLSAELYEPDAKICEKCKEAVMKVREDLKNDPFW